METTDAAEAVASSNVGIEGIDGIDGIRQPDDERFGRSPILFRNAASDFLASAFSGDSDISFSYARSAPTSSDSISHAVAILDHPRAQCGRAFTHTLASAFARFADAASPRWRYAAARFEWYTATSSSSFGATAIASPNAPIASSHRFCAYNSPPRSFALFAAAALDARSDIARRRVRDDGRANSQPRDALARATATRRRNARATRRTVTKY